MRGGLQIGELAARFGLNPKTIRYYEEIGLLPSPVRSESGYRRYDARDVTRLGFIRRAKVLGLTLDEIRDLLSLAAGGERPCQRVLEVVDAKIAEVDRRVQELQGFRAKLAALRADWTDREGPPLGAPSCAPVCPIIEQQAAVAEHLNLAHVLEPAFRRPSRRPTAKREAPIAARSTPSGRKPARRPLPGESDRRR